MTYEREHKLEGNLTGTSVQHNVGSSFLEPMAYLAESFGPHTQYQVPSTGGPLNQIKKHLAETTIILSLMNQWAHLAWNVGSCAG